MVQTTSARVAPAAPAATESGFRVPYGVFTEPGYYDREQERIFRGPHWSFVALEAEIPNSGDYKTTFVGDTPVIVMRGAEGAVHVTVNRCAHRGALVVRDLRGNRSSLECVYHQWCYAPDGKLVGLPFRKGIKGQGGMPADFDMKRHSLQRLRVEVLHGLVFATFSDETPPLAEYLGPMVVESIARIFRRPVRVLGDLRQYVHGNWKLYAENTRDPYHASLLHLFHTTFGTYRSSQKGGVKLDAEHRHSMLHASSDTNDAQKDQEIYKDMRSFNSQFKLQDPSVLAGRREFDDGVTLVILSVFPNLTVQQIANTLAVRQSVPYAPDAFELVWTSFGYADDDAEMQTIRLKQGNLIGPAGLISMEDGEAVEIVQRAVVRDQDKTSFIAMGGSRGGDADHLVTESSIIGFWEYYQRTVGFDPAPVR
jgi:anthranilate 1,2-dioxygenase large subunit